MKRTTVEVENKWKWNTWGYPQKWTKQTTFFANQSLFADGNMCKPIRQLGMGATKSGKGCVLAHHKTKRIDWYCKHHACFWSQFWVVTVVYIFVILQDSYQKTYKHSYRNHINNLRTYNGNRPEIQSTSDQISKQSIEPLTEIIQTSYRNPTDILQGIS